MEIPLKISFRFEYNSSFTEFFQASRNYFDSNFYHVFFVEWLGVLNNADKRIVETATFLHEKDHTPIPKVLILFIIVTRKPDQKVSTVQDPNNFSIFENIKVRDI